MFSNSNIIKPPYFDDPKKEQLAQILHYLLIIAIFFSVFFSIATFQTIEDPSGPLISAGMAVVSVILFILLRKGHLKLVSFILISSAYIAIMTTLYVNGGIRDEANLVFIALLAISGFVLGRKAILILGGTSIISFILLYFGEKQGLVIETEHYLPVGIDELLISLIAILVTTLIVHQFTRIIAENSRQIQQQTETLLNKNQQLQETKSSLENRTKELLATLAGLEEVQAQLIEAKEQAETANQSKNDFLSKISHDLRTPINSIQGFIKLLEETTEESQQEYLHHILRNSDHLLHLINDLLDISRIEAQELKLYPAPLPLISFLHETVAFLQIPAKEKGLTLTYLANDNLPDSIEIDEHRLRQILSNLIGNAIKFTNEGTVSLQATWLSKTSQNSKASLRFEVIDTGIGIAPKELSEIFKPFVQAGSSKEKSQGTGLGLAISDKLVETMGGKLQVESKINEGTRFWFDLPL